MDIEMPRMDGLTALREIMLRMPTPVMMVSSITTDGAQATLDALELGAVDFIPKQSSFVSLDIVKIRDDLLAKIKDIARRKHTLMARYRLRAKPASTPTRRPDRSQTPATPAQVLGKRNHPVNIVAIGSSTGGPPALQAVIPALPRNFPVGVVIAQHMPPTFTASLAARLDSLSQVSVREAVHLEPLEPGTVLISPGGKHLTVKKVGGKAVAHVSDHPIETLYHPCVDVLMESVARSFEQAAMGVILTGMGSNGLAGIRLLKEKNGVTIAQNEESCVVYGMPRAIIEARLADHVAPIEQIANEILSFF